MGAALHVPLKLSSLDPAMQKWKCLHKHRGPFHPIAPRSQGVGAIRNPVPVQVSQHILTHVTVRRGYTAPVAPCPSQDPHFASQTQLLLPPGAKTSPLLSKTQQGFLCQDWSSGQAAVLCSSSSAHTACSRNAVREEKNAQQEAA